MTELCYDILDEIFPVTCEDLIFQMLLMVIRNIGILDSVERKFFEIANVEIPSDVGHQIVHCHSLITKETGIIARDGGLKAFVEHVPYWVASQVSCVTK